MFFRVEEHRIRVFGNRVQRGIFVSKGGGVIRERRKLCNEEILMKYYSGDQIKRNETGAVCSTDKEGRGSYRV
jgi:hypothetical protein